MPDLQRDKTAGFWQRGHIKNKPMVKLRIQTQSLISTVQMRTTSFYTLIIVVVLILLHFFFFFLDLSRLCFLIHHFTSLKSYKVVTKG